MAAIESRARHLVADITAHGVSQATLGELDRLVVRSVATERAYRQVALQYLRWLRDQRIPLQTAHSRAMLLEFLDDFAEVHGQKAVDQARQALQKIFSVTLPHVDGLIKTIARDRAYSFDELARLVQHQTPRNKLASLLCFDAGLRAHECITLARRDAGRPSPHREWSPDRFAGRDDAVIYLAVGKGGLTREVAISRELSQALLECERTRPAAVRDREVNYISYFEIGGGQALSASFSRASTLELGWSHGLHGLRHSFARHRLAALRKLFPPRAALLILSQELGHFRPAVTLTYLGGR